MSVEKRVIKKYPNRRLYDTATSSYITLGDVKQLVLENVDIQVVDAKTQDDITRSVLLQIILEEENGGMPMFSYEVLTQFIRFYGQAMQGMMGPFLEKNLQLFGQMQQKLQEQTRACTVTRRCSTPPCGGVHEAAGSGHAERDVQLYGAEYRHVPGNAEPHAGANQATVQRLCFSRLCATGQGRY
jgi:polyhydroxyalkanoate synthesis repressor PhaR